MYTGILGQDGGGNGQIGVNGGLTVGQDDKIVSDVQPVPSGCSEDLGADEAEAGVDIGPAVRELDLPHSRHGVLAIGVLVKVEDHPGSVTEDC